MTIFVRLLDVASEKKGAVLLESLRTRDDRVVDVSPSEFGRIPGAPFAYWASTAIRQSFEKFPPLGSSGRTARQGLATADDFRFVRAWWEVEALNLNRSWYPMAKGGAYSPYASNIYLTVNWARGGYEITNFYDPITGKQNSRPQGVASYFKPGITWPSRPFKRGGFSLVGPGSIFSHTGTMLFCEDDADLPALTAILNSDAYIGLLHLLLPRGGEGSDRTLQYEVGYVSSVPLPDLSKVDREALEGVFKKAYDEKRRIHSATEVSRLYLLPKAISEARGKAPTYQNEADLSDRLNDIAFGIYGFLGEDRTNLESWSRSESVEIELDVEVETKSAVASPQSDDGDEVSTDGDQEVLSWTIGVAFGRFDIRLATGERPTPREPDPFDPLPANSPGMLPVGDLPFIPTSGVFVDDPGHPDDLTSRVTAVYDRVGETPPAPDKLRRILAKDFFPAHIRMYSKSRRKAPIYWQLATPSTDYSVWLYVHAFGKDTLFRIRNDYVEPKLAHERRELESLRAEAGLMPTTIQSRAIENQTAFVEELSALLDEVKRVAPLWDPDLDDGVVVNFSPLWRLVPQNRAWQKELRATWASLICGDYDWTHLAMRLWPERVVAKCAEDRSLAIAHDLEGVLWAKDENGKWEPRTSPVRSVGDLIAERTIPAVKESLKSLLQAPEPILVTRGGRKSKAS
ncbi:hypothetical protein [Mesorhizobium sp. M0586]|uniref:hypothetical protein n=1 Tax=unclassified Mesorhizobium TaxID=325217 RepID=UPI00333B7EE6